MATKKPDEKVQAPSVIVVPAGSNQSGQPSASGRSLAERNKPKPVATPASAPKENDDAS